MFEWVFFLREWREWNGTWAWSAEVVGCERHCFFVWAAYEYVCVCVWIVILLYSGVWVFLVLTFKNCTVQLTCSIFMFCFFANIFKSLLSFSYQTIEDCATKEYLLDSSKSVLFLLKRCLMGSPTTTTTGGHWRPWFATHTAPSRLLIFFVKFLSLCYLVSLQRRDGNTIIYCMFGCFFFSLDYSNVFVKKNSTIFFAICRQTLSTL